MNRNAVLGLFSMAAVSACTGTGTTISVPLPATAIVVDPADFLGDVPCFPLFGPSADAPGGPMRRYVATLVSEHAGGALTDAEVTLPSSPPTRCSDRVSFQRVVDGTAYVAEIDGYDVDHIRPLGSGGILGSRVMVDEHDRFVAPRWQTSCGKAPSPTPELVDAASVDAAADAVSVDAAADAVSVDATADAAPKDASDARTTTQTEAGVESLDTGVPPYGRCTGHALKAGNAPNLEGPVCAIANHAVPIRGCATLREANPPKVTTTAITVDLHDALTGAPLPDGGQCPALSCGSGTGQIAQFRVALDGSPEPPRTAGCGDSIPFEVPPGKLATFTITAYGSGASPSVNACETGDGGAAAVGADCNVALQLDKGDGGIWCTRCFAEPVPGLTLRATCDPLGSTQRRPY
jgi:hypothetical protein